MLCSDISVRKIILVTVSFQFGCNNFCYSTVTLIKKSSNLSFYSVTVNQLISVTVTVQCRKFQL